MTASEHQQPISQNVPIPSHALENYFNHKTFIVALCFFLHKWAVFSGQIISKQPLRLNL